MFDIMINRALQLLQVTNKTYNDEDIEHVMTDH